MDVYIDFKSPAAYLATQPTRALAERIGEPINWLPVQTKQSAIPEEQASEDRGTTHRRVRAIARQNMHLHYANVLGLTMNFRNQPGNTDLALVALETLSGDRDAFVRAAFAAYWTTNADLSDSNVIDGLLSETNCQANLSEPETKLDAIFERFYPPVQLLNPTARVHKVGFDYQLGPAFYANAKVVG